jgi:hypothetical protein
MNNLTLQVGQSLATAMEPSKPMAGAMALNCSGEGGM